MTSAVYPAGDFAICKPRIFPVPDDMRQATIADAKGLIFVSDTPRRGLQFWPGIGEWRTLTGLAAEVWIGGNDNYVAVPISRPEALLWLRSTAPNAHLPD